MKLLYRKSKYIDESFPDYLARLSYWNGFENPQVFVKRLLKLYASEYGGGPYRRTWRAAWLKCRGALEHILQRSIHTTQLNLVKLRRDGYRSSRICTRCWKEKPYVRFFWRLDRYRICHIHGVSLIVVDNVTYKPNAMPMLVNTTIRQADKLYHHDFTALAVKMHRSSDSALERVIEEEYLLDMEKTLWLRVAEFLRGVFLLHIDSSSIWRWLDTGAHIGAPVWQRLEATLKNAVSENKPYEKVIRLITVILIAKGNWRPRYPPEMMEWAVCAAYSISPLCYSYIYGVKEHLFASGYDSYFGAVVRPVSFSLLTERQIYEFILKSSILTASEIENLPQGHRTFRSGIELYSSIDSGEYVDATKPDIFSGSVEPRSMSEEAIGKLAAQRGI